MLLSAAAFAVSYLPWMLGGPLLAALAERYPYRRVMIICDLVRMVLIALVADPRPADRRPCSALLFLATLGNPPDAGRPLGAAAADPRPATSWSVGDRGEHDHRARPPRSVGYLAGAALAAAINPRLALLHRRAAPSRSPRC